MVNSREETIMIITLTNPKVNACVWYRLIIPYTNECLLEANNYLNVELLGKADHIVMHKDSYSEVLVNHFKDTKYILDIDDLLEVPSDHISYKSYIERDISKLFKDRIERSDILTTTNETLRDYLLQFNKPVIINPNTVDLNFEPHLPLDKLRIVYGGGITHRADILTLKNLTKYIKQDFTFDVFTREYKSILGNKNIKLLNHIPVEDFLKVYNNYNITIAPLKDNFFNKCKSNLKFIEAAFTRTLFIGQNINTYGEVIDNETGILFDDKYELTDILNNVTVEDIKRITDNAYNYVKDKYDVNTLRLELKNNILSI